jgi:hypothetical protein
MKRLFVLTSALAVVAMAATPVLAKKPAKRDGGKGSGAYCYQGADNVFIPAAEIKPSVRNRLRKGQKFKFNYPGYGPINCVVY